MQVAHLAEGRYHPVRQVVVHTDRLGAVEGGTDPSWHLVSARGVAPRKDPHWHSVGARTGQHCQVEEHMD